MNDSVLFGSEAAGNHSFALLVACHNRKPQTLAFLDSIFRGWPANYSLRVILMDDGSTDGTAAAVAACFPQVRVENGTGSLFWNGAMSRLMAVALNGSFQHVILANDDIQLFNGNLSMFVDSYLRLNRDAQTVLVAPFADPDTGDMTYSGICKTGGLSPMNVLYVQPRGQLERCDTFNANFVIVPSSALREVGGLDNRFTHGFGDMDLGYRLTRSGINLLVYNSFVGTCSRNPIQDTRCLSLRQRWFINFNRVNVAADYRYFVRKHAPLVAPFLIAKDTATRFWRSLLPA